MKLSEKAYAKINLGLNIVAKREDGYHNIETIFYPIPLYDKITIETEQKEDKLFTEGLLLDCSTEENILFKTLNLLRSQGFEIPPLHIHLDKKIPFGAGLGGGSSDAACLLNLLSDYYKLGLKVEDKERMISNVGADCAFFIESKTKYATGIGNVFTPIDVDLKKYFLVLLAPNITIPTAKAYAKVVPHQPKINIKDIIRQPPIVWKESLVNDFEYSVFMQEPSLSLLKEKLYNLGAFYASMSGSGSSIFGLFEEKPKGIETAFQQEQLIHSPYIYQL